MADSALHPATALLERAIKRHEKSLSASMRRCALFMRDNPGLVISGSAIELARGTGSSDATIVRTAKALGFEGLPDLRRQLVQLFDAPGGSSGRMRASLQDMPADLQSLVFETIETSRDALLHLQSKDNLAAIGQSVALLADAPRIAVFGQGSARAMAHFFIDMLVRFGFPTLALTARGADLADQMLQVEPDDVIVAIVVGDSYEESDALIRHLAVESRAVVVVGNRIDWDRRRDVTQYVSAGDSQSERITPKTPFFMVLEAILLGLAQRRPDLVTESLGKVDVLRRTLGSSNMRR